MPAQLPMNFTPGLLEQFPDFMDCVRASVYDSGRPFKVIASDMDMTVSELGRRLTDDAKDLPFQLRRLPDLIRATGDDRPAQWLALSFLADPQTAEQRALNDLSRLAPIFIALASNAGLTGPAAGARVKR